MKTLTLVITIFIGVLISFLAYKSLNNKFKYEEGKEEPSVYKQDRKYNIL